ncbi:MAG: DUF86 domain-containing protein [Armatimonadetes bacterium]|nr:DUF86 domain-containing protein [Armatimonadota bacterium]
MTLVRELLTEIERNLRLLEELRGLSREEFTSDPHRYLLAERCFQIAIQCIVDTGFYLAAQQGWQRPQDSGEAILTMGRQGAIPGEFAVRIQGMAGFRNVLVHAYLGINRDMVYDYLSRLDDFTEFMRHIEEYLGQG